MRNKIFILILSIFIVGPACDNENTKPNIILMMADDLGWGDTGFNGNLIIKTPNLDRLAESGIRFKRFYSASPVCSPTRASVLTGRNPYRMGIPTANSGHLKEEEITIAEILKGKGYRTGHFGKWHLGTFTTTRKDANRGKPDNYEDLSIPSQHGFDVFFSTESKVPTFDPMRCPIAFDTLNGESLRFGWTAMEPSQASVFYGTNYWSGLDTLATGDKGGDDSKLILDHAIPFMKDATEAKIPFLTVIWLHAPHLPVVVPSVYKDSYSKYSNEEQIYFGAVTALDEQVGRMWEFLRKIGAAENTLFFFCSDNGPEVRTPGSAGPFKGRKRDLYEGGIRVPAFAVWKAGFKSNGSSLSLPLTTTDYLPTILDILSIEYPDDRILDGQSYADILLSNKINQSGRLRDTGIGFQYPGASAWMTDQYKLIQNGRNHELELFDLINDPAEQVNIILSRPDLARQFKKDLQSWITSCESSSLGKDYPKQ